MWGLPTQFERETRSHRLVRSRIAESSGYGAAADLATIECT